MRMKATGSYRKVGEWGINFGPLSNVDEAIPDSGGVTLRDLRDLGEISDDCFDHSDDEKEIIAPAALGDDEQEEG